MRLSDRLQGLCAQSRAKTGLGKKPYNTKKYGIIKTLLEMEYKLRPCLMATVPFRCHIQMTVTFRCEMVQTK